MMKYKHIISLLLGMIMLSCNNSEKKAEISAWHLADTLIYTDDEIIPSLPTENAIYVGQKIDDFVSLTEQLYTVKKEKNQLEGHDYDIYTVYQNERKIFGVEPDANKPNYVWRIWIYSPEIKTEKGISLGSTLADLKTKYQIENIGTEEGLNITVKDIDVTFLMDDSTLPQDWWNTMDNGKIPESLSIAQIILVDTNSFLTLDKKIIVNK